jgi:hypothetical protein
VGTDLISDVMIQIYQYHYKYLLEMYRPRCYSNPDFFTFEHTFEKVSEMTTTSRLYSKPYCIMGYDFYYFLRLYKNTTEYLSGYLQCTSAMMPAIHKLPVSMQYTISTSGHKNRIFKPVKVIFTMSEKAIGGKLLTGAETWEDIKSGKSEIVVNDTITISAKIHFLNTTDDCQAIINCDDSQAKI